MNALIIFALALLSTFHAMPQEAFTGVPAIAAPLGASGQPVLNSGPIPPCPPCVPSAASGQPVING
ncbi:preprotein translocase subunit SecG domain protein [Oesophagostomum dentatum]|uniref:Preprotein translocase subunit SecG domain protein n=1 Tax=Oesophagostomum dentatum TaxID=61180 RepID=A0A0B1SE94_OESDE|nr:preprotein translocase subunit SecG domain protein [Oesophagostomum dentatum]